MRVLGYVSDDEKWRWFADADVFASLSAYEGLPVATLEALSFGCPVVLSDIPAHRAVIEEYDATGQCVTPADAGAAIEAVVGRSVDVELPSWRESAEVYLGLVENAAVRSSNSEQLSPHS